MYVPRRMDLREAGRTDEDGLLDGYDIAVGIGDARYALWATNGIVYFEGIVDFSAADVQGLDLGTGA